MSDSLIVTLTVGQLRNIVAEVVQEKIIQYLPPPPVKLLTSKEAAVFLRITDPTLKVYREQGLVQRHVVGNTMRYKQHELEAALVTLKKYKSPQRA
jgi:hypothetical protein